MKTKMGQKYSIVALRSILGFQFVVIIYWTYFSVHPELQS
jgi:hypothetical protein